MTGPERDLSRASTSQRSLYPTACSRPRTELLRSRVLTLRSLHDGCHGALTDAPTRQRCPDHRKTARIATDGTHWAQQACRLGKFASFQRQADCTAACRTVCIAEIRNPTQHAPDTSSYVSRRARSRRMPSTERMRPDPGVVQLGPAHARNPGKRLPNPGGIRRRRTSEFAQYPARTAAAGELAAFRARRWTLPMYRRGPAGRRRRPALGEEDG
jgi:hypothetical protein